MKTICLGFLTFLILASCNSVDHKKMLAGTYYYHLRKNNSCIEDYLGTKVITLTLNRDGSYFFTPSVEKLKAYEGSWEVEELGDDIGGLILKYKDGEIHKANSIHFDITVGDTICQLYFTDIKPKE